MPISLNVTKDPIPSNVHFYSAFRLNMRVWLTERELLDRLGNGKITDMRGNFGHFVTSSTAGCTRHQQRAYCRGERGVGVPNKRPEFSRMERFRNEGSTRTLVLTRWDPVSRIEEEAWIAEYYSRQGRLPRIPRNGFTTFVGRRKTGQERKPRDVWPAWLRRG